MIVFSRRHFNVYSVGNGYIAHNTKLPFSNGHTHLKSLKYAKQLIDNVLGKKRPKTKNLYLLESHLRVSNDKNYIKLVEELIESRKTPRGYYININKGIKSRAY